MHIKVSRNGWIISIVIIEQLIFIVIKMDLSYDTEHKLGRYLNDPLTVAQDIVGFTQLEELVGASGFFVSARMKLQCEPSITDRREDIINKGEKKKKYAPETWS